MSEKTLDIVCIGNAIVDVIATVEDSFLEGHGMVKGSMQLIDDGVAHLLYDDMPPSVETSGGSAANTAAGIASFGGQVGFVGKVAGDQLGEVFIHDLRATGVEFTPLAVPPAQGAMSTARCLILVTPDAERTMNTFLGISCQIGPVDVDAELVSRAQVVYCEGYLWDLPDAKDALVKGMDSAHAAGGKVAFSLSDSFCVDRHRAEFRALIEERVDILFGNEAEILSLFEVDSFDMAADQVAGLCEIAALTRGAQGSTVVTATERLHVTAAPVAAVVDTTGAGDLYAAGFLYGWTHGETLETAGRLGSLAAAEVIGHIGSRPLVSLAELAKQG